MKKKYRTDIDKPSGAVRSAWQLVHQLRHFPTECLRAQLIIYCTHHSFHIRISARTRIMAFISDG